ncbi:hypothetical protein EV421DRAFT_1805196 [Armillaria borealis]|uniref:Uncharacterized protein n=1 Tax=Armillaria borealis TaxID=47425 RepID=A0AA39JIB4_9AGAR|nr:hypothetical protein EV421DRAFT_1805196 [Armillaria borealis]
MRSAVGSPGSLGPHSRSTPFLLLLFSNSLIARHANLLKFIAYPNSFFVGCYSFEASVFLTSLRLWFGSLGPGNDSTTAHRDF